MIPPLDGDEIMGTSRISKKFQITVPKSVRVKYSLNEADLLIFIGDGDVLALKKAKSY